MFHCTTPRLAEKMIQALVYPVQPCIMMELLTRVGPRLVPALSVSPSNQAKLGKGNAIEPSCGQEETGGALEVGRVGGGAGSERVVPDSAG